MLRVFKVATLLAVIAATGSLTAFKLNAQEKADKPPEVKSETLLTGLDNPSGVAVRPVKKDPYEVFVTDSAAGRIVKVSTDAPDKPKVIVSDFPQDIYGKGPQYKIGPLGLAFLDQYTLVVADGSNKDGEELVRVYELNDSKKEPLKASEMKTKLGPVVPEKTAEQKEAEKAKAAADPKAPPPSVGEGNFYAIAVADSAIYITSNGDDTKGWVLKALRNGTSLSQLKPFLKTKELVNLDAPVAATMSPRGELVVGQMGEMNVPKDSLLTFYNLQTEKLIMKLETGLHDIAGLAYSPKSGRLYAVDFAWVDTKDGGLYRLDAVNEGGKDKVKVVKVMSLDKPSALAFDKDGALYVTVFGTATEGDTKTKPGKLLKITGDL